MPTPTYDLIQEQVLGSAAATVTFSSIPGTYKDLVLEIIATTVSGSGGPSPYLQFNNDTATNYSQTSLYGTGSLAVSSRISSNSFGFIGGFSSGWSATDPGVCVVNIMNYTSTNVYKTYLSRFGVASLETDAIVGLWRKTPEAITSIKISTAASSYNTNSTFRLWGVAG